jgi:DNA-binding NarL/FixJ family response regulator
VNTESSENTISRAAICTITASSSPRSRARPARGWEALTPAEAKIAYLVAEGKSNPDIAAELWLSRNTVETHVSRILAKLGARSRMEIARQALQHPPAAEHAPAS